MNRPFIQANWKKLLMFNYAIDPKILLPYVPYNTEIAVWNNTCYVSLVGFLFQDVKLQSFAIPLHTNFVEINLRFYVRHLTHSDWKYGVVFIKEIVALPMVSFIANSFFNEHYETLPVQHKLEQGQQTLFLEYRWKKNKWHTFNIHCQPEKKPIEENTLEYFLTTQHWGYTKLKEDRSREYSVVHPRWDIYPTKNYSANIDYAEVYGNQFGFLSTQRPDSVFLAEGSSILMMKSETIKAAS